MSGKRWSVAASACLAVATGVAIGVLTALSVAPRPAFAGGRVAIVSWRGRGDSLPPGWRTYWEGWPAPIYYTTPEEGAFEDGPEGRYPTGIWAPGDSWERVLTVKNVSHHKTLRLEAIDAVVRGDLELAPWFRVEIRSPHNQVIYQGSLGDLAEGIRHFTDERGRRRFLEMPGHSIQHLTFTVTLDQATPFWLQGRHVTADFRLYATPADDD
jgi:hypothetical protein